MRSKLRSIVRSLRNNEFVWRYGFNLAPSFRYSAKSRSILRPVERSILSRLNRDGIAIASVDELLGDSSAFDELSAATDAMLAARTQEIAELEAKAGDTSRIGSKTFNLELLGSELTFDPSTVFARFPLSPALLNVANAYLRMYARLRYYNVWYTFATDSAARESQLWHFDREDNYILKIFVYLKDVDIGTGPFTYAPGTHRKGPHWNRKPESFTENNVLRTPDDPMNAVIPRERWITATGRKGTVVFADTRGYHKGGEARTAHRLMFTCMYTSPASDSKQLLRFPLRTMPDNLSKNQRLALSVNGWR